MKRLWIIVGMGLCLTSSLFAMENEMTLPELRMDKRFGFGFSAAGPLSILGLEIDINLNEQLSIGGGIGTGLDYSTFMVKGRYFMLGRSVSPYIGMGVARWWTSEPVEDFTELGPSMLADAFLTVEDDLSEGFNIWTVYPVLGVQFMHPMGLALFAELQYLFKLVDFSNGTYAGLGLHWYF